MRDAEDYVMLELKEGFHIRQPISYPGGFTFLRRTLNCGVGQLCGYFLTLF